MSGSVGVEGLFRREALRRSERDAGEGEALRLTPSWARLADAALAAVLVLAAALLLFLRVDEWASGPAVVRFPEWREVTALEAGVVEVVEVAPGQRVAAGEVLLQLHDRAERQEEHRLEREYELLLVRLLTHPGDDTARVGLARLRAERRRAAARRTARIVKAPAGGLVRELRARRGQRIVPGDHLVSIGAAEAPAEVLAFFPGEDAPRLVAGMSARLELFGYQRTRLELAVHYVSGDVVEPSAARRYVGPELGDVVPTGRPSAIARLPLPQVTFESDDRTYPVLPGMRGLVEVAIGREPLLFAIVPALGEWWRRLDV